MEEKFEQEYQDEVCDNLQYPQPDEGCEDYGGYDDYEGIEDEVCDNASYDHMIANLKYFVIRVSQKLNPTSAELAAMTEISKLLSSAQ